MAALLVPTACGGMSRDNWPSERPRIDEVRFLGQDPGYPWSLVFALDFTSGASNTGSGKLRLSIDEVEVDVISLMGLFGRQRPPLELEVELEPDVESGRELDFGFVLQDARGRSSNEPRVVLRVVIPE